MSIHGYPCLDINVDIHTCMDNWRVTWENHGYPCWHPWIFWNPCMDVLWILGPGNERKCQTNKEIKEQVGAFWGRRLDYVVADIGSATNSKSALAALGIRAMTDMRDKGAAALIGPDESCGSEALVAAAWNLPIISYVSQVLLCLWIHTFSFTSMQGDWVFVHVNRISIIKEQKILLERRLDTVNTKGWPLSGWYQVDILDTRRFDSVETWRYSAIFQVIYSLTTDIWLIIRYILRIFFNILLKSVDA